MADGQQKAALTLLDPAAMQCPFQTYDAMRTQSPVYRDAVTGFLVVTRFADVRAIAADPQTFSNRTGILQRRTSAAKGEVARLFEAEGFPPIDTLVTNDPPDHRRYRTLVDKVFSPVRVRDAEPSILALVDALIDRFPARPFDFVPAFSVPLPVRMIAGQLGVPQAREADFKRWSDALIAGSHPNLTREQEIANAKAVIEMQLYFRDLVRQARAEPTGTLLSALAITASDDGLMSEGEVVSLLQQILVAGNETTTNVISAAVLRLAEDETLQDELRANVARVPAFVEEVLRLDAPLQGLFRLATRDTEVGGVAVPEGTILDIRWAAGNRDERNYPHAGTVDLDRKNPSQHLSFGYGIHFCIGNQLARAELRTGITRLLERSSRIGLADMPAPTTREGHFIAYGLSSLTIEYRRG